jgi:hypothetical protein
MIPIIVVVSFTLIALTFISYVVYVNKKDSMFIKQFPDNARFANNKSSLMYKESIAIFKEGDNTVFKYIKNSNIIRELYIRGEVEHLSETISNSWIHDIEDYICGFYYEMDKEFNGLPIMGNDAFYIFGEDGSNKYDIVENEEYYVKVTCSDSNSYITNLMSLEDAKRKLNNITSQFRVNTIDHSFGVDSLVLDKIVSSDIITIKTKHIHYMGKKVYIESFHMTSSGNIFDKKLWSN